MRGIGFRTDERGAVAPIFAFMIVALLAVSGGAVDLERVHSMKTRLQEIADASVLAAAADISDANADRSALAREHFNIRASNIDAQIEVSATSTPEGVMLTASTSVDSTLLKVLGIDGLQASVRSGASFAEPLEGEIALVLDYSGSMNRNGKYQAMRDAAIDLVNTLMGPGVSPAAADRMKIGLVPFSEYVYTDMRTDFIRDVHPDHFGKTVRACLASRRHPYATEQSTPVSTINGSRWAAPGMPATYREPGASSSSINGAISYANCSGATKRVCVSWDDGDCESWKVYPADECERIPTLGDLVPQVDEALASDFAAVDAQCADYSSRNLVVQPLTNDETKLITQLDAMRPLRLTDIEKWLHNFGQ